MKVQNAVPVRLAGIGHYFPGEPIGNEFFEQTPSLQVDDAWIRRHTGVASRHWAGEDERHVDLAERAARMALNDAGLDVGDVDLVIATSATSRPSTNPTTSENSYADLGLPLQARLGLMNAACFDLAGLACAGFLHASVITQALMGSSTCRTVLVVCAENPRPILNLSFRNSVLFGGGAAAAVWTRGTEGDEGDISAAVLGSDGRHFGAFDIDPGGAIIMRGGDVNDFAPGCLVDVGRTALEQAGLTSSDIDWFVPHQANVNLIDQVVAELMGDHTRVLTNLSRRGNTSSVGVPGCLSEAVHAGTVRPGDRVLTCSIGRGFSWGAMVLSYSGAAADQLTTAGVSS